MTQFKHAPGPYYCAAKFNLKLNGEVTPKLKEYYNLTLTTSNEPDHWTTIMKDRNQESWVHKVNEIIQT